MKVLVSTRMTPAEKERALAAMTKSPAYKQKKALRPGKKWWLDNSMMNANVQQTRQFYEHLRKYADSRRPGVQ